MCARGAFLGGKLINYALRCMSLLNWFMKAASQTPLFLLRLCYFNMVGEGQILQASRFLGFVAPFVLCRSFESKHVRL